MNAPAREEYSKRRGRLEHRIAYWKNWERRLSVARLIAFGTTAALLWAAYGPPDLPGAWIAPPAVGFVLLLVSHDRVIRRRRRAERAAKFYARGLSRIDGHWAGQGDAGEEFRDADHPFCDDLDIFGVGSLFEFLSNARTKAGREQLAEWLRSPADAMEIRARQAAVGELRPQLDLREDLAILGEDLESRLDPRAVSRWANEDLLLVSRRGPVLLAALLSAGTTLSGASWILAGTGPFPFTVAVLAQIAFALAWRRRVRTVIRQADQPVRDLGLLRLLLERLEAESFETSRLVQLQEGLGDGGPAPSLRIAQLDRLQRLLDARLNQFFVPIGALLLWGTQFAFAIERWREENGAAITRWIDSSAEFEALASLSGYAYENPRSVFPELAPEEDGPLFEGVELGHPLVHESENVLNDVSLNAETRALIVSGSNMSGKSTLLRSIGINLVLAQAGAPVRAGQMRISRLAVGASIRVNDSLQKGTSRFYAEILRLRAILDLAGGERKTIFLLDEILHGTNSHDRQRGAQGVIRSLLERGGIGLVTTHDLALTRIAEEPELCVANVHFEDRVTDGRVEFDYHLRPGIVENSNALDLMRAIGLDV
ncbi:MAG: DNA mismatch repair protein MutS [Myxococcota bacterium]|nr:DNA mismatch repair protein MutS [Myxococcota bacterium]